MFLGIDTATPYLSLALWSPQHGHMASFCERVERDHAARMLGELERLLALAEVPKHQLCGVGVGVGPGSYTGLRVGIATAKGLARALAIPLRAESSLAAIAAAVLQPDQMGIIALDARRGNVYAGMYKKTAEGLRCLAAPQKCLLTDMTAAYPTLELFLDAAPEAAYLAQRVAAGSNRVEPLYL